MSLTLKYILNICKSSFFIQQFRITYPSLRAFHKYFDTIVDHILDIIFGTQFESLPWIFVYIHTTMGWLAWVNILSPIFEPITRKSVKISKFLSHHAMLLYTAQCTAQYGVELFLKKNSYIVHFWPQARFQSRSKE